MTTSRAQVALGLQSFERWAHESPIVDWFYIGGFAAVLALAAYILSIG